MDPLYCGQDVAAGQGCDGRRAQPPGTRRCLLKGCERWFRPARPQCCYCSPACQAAARRWRRWRAAQTYRGTPHGKECRRAQSCRYRERRRERQAAAADNPERPREGQRPAEIPGRFPQKSACDRPGCYELFVLTPLSSAAAFLYIGLPSGVTASAAAGTASARAPSPGSSTATPIAARPAVGISSYVVTYFRPAACVPIVSATPKEEGAGGSGACPPPVSFFEWGDETDGGT